MTSSRPDALLDLAEHAESGSPTVTPVQGVVAGASGRVVAESVGREIGAVAGASVGGPTATRPIDAAGAWARASDHIRHALGPYDHRHWIRPLLCRAMTPSKGVDGEPDVVVVELEAPDDTHAHWVEESFLEALERGLEAALGRPARAVVSAEDIDGTFQHVSGQHASGSDGPLSAEALGARHGRGPGDGRALGGIPDAAPVRADPPTLIGRYTFDHFVDGPTNRFAAAASRAVGERPGTRYNPLFIYGGAGLGKTHLLHAIGHEVYRRDASKRVVYVSSEAFVNDLIEAIRGDRMSQFRRRYRDRCDVLLVDDIQFISGKERTQEEFFHLFNTLHAAHKQIVLTSDTVPQSIPQLEERLQSRLSWGLMTSVHPPCFETRVAILQRKAMADGLVVCDDVAMHLAKHVTRNVRELEGALMRVGAAASMLGVPMSVGLADEVLGDLVEATARRVEPGTIMKTVAARFSVSIQDMKGPRRHRAVTVPRQVAMFLVRSLTDLSLPQIGQHFGGRDHSTVLNALRRVDDLCAADPGLDRQVAALRRELSGE